MKRALVLSLIMALAFSFLFYGIVVQPVESQTSETIYIRVDGTVEGTDKIQRDGEVYTLTSDITGGIVVEKNFTVIDGAGYTLQGNGEGEGISIKMGVTVQNLQIINFTTGIAPKYNNTIIGNYIADCFTGINILGGSNNTIKNNTIANNVNGVSICYSGGNHIVTENNMINDEVSSNNVIIVWLSPQPTVDRNYWSDYHGIDNDGDGVGDTPYVYIDTDYAKYADNHPLMSPVVIPEFPTAEPSPTPTFTPEITPTPSPTASPSPSPSSTPIPTGEPEQPGQDMTAGAILAVASIVIFLGLLVYFKKRKH